MKIRMLIKNTVKDVSERLSANTARVYKNGLDQFLEHLQVQGLSPDDDESKLTPDHFITYPTFLSNKDYTKQSIGVYLSSATALLNFLIIRGKFDFSYRADLRWKRAVAAARKKHEFRIPRFPDDETVSKILEAADLIDSKTPIKERNKAIVYMLATSGCRNAELISLRIADIDLRSCTAIVTGKGAKERQVFFSPDSIDYLKAYWKARKSCHQRDPAFARHDHLVGPELQPISTSTVRNVVDNFCKIAGIDCLEFSPHYFRHAFAIRMLAETSNLALVQDYLGHSDPKATRVYAKINQEQLVKTHQRIFGNKKNRGNP